MSSLPPSEHTHPLAPAEHPALPAHASPASSGLADDASQHPAPGQGVAPPAPARRSSWLRVVVIALIVLLAVAFVVYRIRTNKAADQKQANSAKAMADRPVPVSVDTVQERTIPVYLNALGTVTAYNTVTLKSRVDGEIVRINFREGQRVAQGQLLIEIDPRPYQAALAQAQGNLARDQANAANAQVEAQRYNQLYAAGVVSKEQAQTQESTSGQAVGTLEGDRAAIRAAKVNLDYTRITSPIPGIVGLRQVDIGNVIAANSSTGLVVITQVEPIAVIFTLPEDQLPQVFERMRSGRHLTVEAWDRGNVQKLATGELLTVDNQIDTTTGTAKLKAVFQNHDLALYPNQFVNIRLILEDRQDSLTIPAAALESGTTGNFVWLVDTAHPIAPAQTAAAENQSAAEERKAEAGTTPENRASGSTAGAATGRSATGAGGAHQTSYPVIKQPVQVDLTQGNTVIIRGGLQAGQHVITDGQERLSEKSKVIPRAMTPTSALQPTLGKLPGNRGQAANRPKTGTTFEHDSTADTNGQGSQGNQQGTTAGAPRT